MSRKYNEYDLLRIGQPWFGLIVFVRGVCSIGVPLGSLASLYAAYMLSVGVELAQHQILLYWGIIAGTVLAVILDAVCKYFFRWGGKWMRGS